MPGDGLLADEERLGDRAVRDAGSELGQDFHLPGREPVPSTDLVTLRTSGGDIELLQTGGAVRATTSGGDVLVRDAAGSVSVKTSGGDLELERITGTLDGQTSGGNIIFFGGIALIFYFLIWRPQSKRAKEHKDLMSSLNKGDEVMTNGGILGKLTKVDDNYIVLQIHDNVEIKMQKSAVAAVLPKGTIKSI